MYRIGISPMPNVATVVAFVCLISFASAVNMKIVNYAGYPVDVYWVSLMKRGELVKQLATPIRNGTDSSINTYDTHSFVIKWAEHLKFPKSQSATFTHGKHDSVVTIYPDIDNGLRVDFRDNFQIAFDGVSSNSEACLSQFSDLENSRAEFLDCVTSGVAEQLDQLTTKLQKLKEYNVKIANRLRNYTCSDPDMQSTTPTSYEYLNWHGKNIRAGNLYQSDHARIMLVEDFITASECDVLINHGTSRLERATVAAADGSSVLSESRRAQQASYELDITNEKDPLYDLKHRIFALTNKMTGYNLTLTGQEELTIIQYNPADQYMPHCDGACDGGNVRVGGRVATIVLYCKAPEIGGGTTFSKADVFVQPKAGNAVFFSYLGEDGVLDDGFTEHSGCPVIEGEKWITTQWMRWEVSNDNPWTKYDPQGGRV